MPIDPKEVTDKEDVWVTPATTTTRGSAQQPQRHVHTVKVGDRERQVHGMLTRAGMEQVIKSGGSFHWPSEAEDGSQTLKVVTTLADIPSDLAIAKATGDAALIQKAKAENAAEIERLRRENASAVVPPAAPAAPVVPVAPKK